MADRLVQGQPLTYEYLQDLERQVDNLQRNVSNLLGRVKREEELQNLSVLIDYKKGYKNARTPPNVQILAGSLKISFTGNARPVIFQKAYFDRGFAVEPVVVATVHDPERLGASDKVAFATVTIGDVTPKAFEFKVEMIRQGQNIMSNDLYLNYIAIGRQQ